MRTKRHKLVTIGVVCIVAGGILAFGYRTLFRTGVNEGSKSGSGAFLPNLAKVTNHLYFTDQDGQFLKAEERSLVRQDSPVQRAKGILNALIKGPRGAALLPTLPAETKLLSVYVTEDGVAFVDFDRTVSEKHPGGSLSELFTVFSVVNSVALNVPEIEAVKILVEGREVGTLAGHIDIRFPLRPNILMIR